MTVKFEEAELEDEHSDSFSVHDLPELIVSCKIKNAETHMNAQKQLNLFTNEQAEHNRIFSGFSNRITCGRSAAGPAHCGDGRHGNWLAGVPCSHCQA